MYFVGGRKEERWMSAHHEELFGGARVKGSVGDLRLLGQVVGTLDGGNHPLHGEERSQVRRVGGDDDEGEKPPDTSHDSP